MSGIFEMLSSNIFGNGRTSCILTPGLDYVSLNEGGGFLPPTSCSGGGGAGDTHGAGAAYYYLLFYFFLFEPAYAGRVRKKRLHIIYYDFLSDFETCLFMKDF